MSSIAISLILDCVKNTKLILDISKDDVLDAVLPFVTEITNEITFLSKNVNNMNDELLYARLVEVSKLLMELSLFVLFDYNN